MKLEGRTAVVVGAGQTPGGEIGNGRAAALTYAGEGARVLCLDLDFEAAQTTAEMIRSGGGEAEALEADASSEPAMERALNHAVASWNTIDILHNNVGIGWPSGDASVIDIDMAVFDHICRVNINSMVLACKHVIPIMRRQLSGAIINISSVAVLTSHPYIAYKTSKSSVISLTENVALANAQYGIRCNSVLPGLIDTPMAIEPRLAQGRSLGEVRKERLDRIPLGRLGSAWDVARASLFLASDDASFITGVALAVDGGQTLQVG